LKMAVTLSSTHPTVSNRTLVFLPPQPLSLLLQLRPAMASPHLHQHRLVWSAIATSSIWL
jgi:hypothetical protein